jgi:LSD1 subclass zinc finger protein
MAAPTYTEGNDPQWQQLKKVVLECQPFKDGCSTIVCVRCFKLLAFPSGAKKIVCGACQAPCSSVQARCLSCSQTLTIPLGSAETQCPKCHYVFKPVVRIRVQVPEVLARKVPPPIVLTIQVDASLSVGGSKAPRAFQHSVIGSQPLSSNVAAWERTCGGGFHRVVLRNKHDAKLEGGRTPIELGLESGDSVTVYAAPAPPASESGGGGGTSSISHDFQVTNLTSPTNCALCHSFIWGVYGQGKRCARCGMSVHHRCADECTVACDAARRLALGVMDFDEDGDGIADDSAGAAVVAVPVDDPAAFLSACKEDVPPECDPQEMRKVAQLADLDDDAIAALWTKYDADKSGVLEMSEATKFLAEVVLSFPGASPMDPTDPKNKEVLTRLLRRLDTSGDGIVDWEEFYSFVQTQKDVRFLEQFAGSSAEFTTEQLYELWNRYDADGSGELECEEVVRLLAEVTRLDPKALQKPADAGTAGAPAAKATSSALGIAPRQALAAGKASAVAPQVAAKKAAAPTGAHMLTSFIKTGKKVTWDVFYSSIVPVIQGAVASSKK